MHIFVLPIILIISTSRTDENYTKNKRNNIQTALSMEHNIMLEVEIELK